MNREDFLAELEQRLAGLPAEDREERLSFYNEMIDDRLEDGLSEAEALASLGTPEAVAAQVLAEVPMSVLVREKVKPREKPWGWEVILIILGFPIWFSVLVAVLAVGFSLYVCLWAVVLCAWAVAVSLFAGALGCLGFAGLYMLRRNPGGAGCSLGAALVCAGLALVWTAACVAITRGAAKLTKGIWLDIKTLLGRKGRSE